MERATSGYEMGTKPGVQTSDLHPLRRCSKQSGKETHLFTPGCVISIKGKEFPMLTFAVLICLGLLAFLGGDWFQSQFSAEELSKMGIQKR